LPELINPFHDRELLVTACGRLSLPATEQLIDLARYLGLVAVEAK
jgi:hypothetical protein